MTGTSQDDLQPNWKAQSGDYPVSVGQSGWVSWLVFAGVMLAIVGLLQVMAGLTALLNDEYYAVPSNRLFVSIDYTVWGWAHLALGVIALGAAFGLLRGNIVGRVLAVVIACLSVVVNIAFLHAYPWWAVLAIAFDVLVIYAITRHGSELKPAP